MPRTTRPTRRHLAVVPAAGLTIALLAACGGGTADTAAGSDAEQTAANGGAGAKGSTTGQNGTQGRGTGGRQMPGASGKIAEISGTTMQVQNTSTQTAVSWTEDTAFTDTVSAKSSDLAVGDCISVTPAATDVDGADDSAPVTAAAISISDAVDGACGFGGAGFPGGQRAGGERAPAAGQTPDRGQRPDSGQRPDGEGQGNRGAFRGGVSGKVVSIQDATVTVEMTRSAMPTDTAAAAPGANSAAISRTVIFSATTTWTQTESAASEALEVGRCVTAIGTTAIGTTGSTGAVTATSITIRSATDGECTGGFMMRGQGVPTNTTAGA